MKDPWVNIGYEDDKLRPFIETSRQIDQKRIGVYRSKHARLFMR